MKGDIQNMQGDIQNMKGDIQNMKGDIQDMKGDIQNMKGDIQDMKGDIRNMKGDILNMKGEILSIKGELHLVRLCQENMILPRLNTIESCYTDTYTRYKEYADRMDSTFSDVDLLKRVVAEQSEKIQKLA